MRRQAALWMVCFSLLAQAQAGGGSSSVCGASPTMNLADIQQRLTAAEALWQRRGREAYELITDDRGQLSSRMTVQVNGPVTRGQVITQPLLLPGQPAVAPVGREAGAASARRCTVPGLFAQVYRLLRRHRPLRAIQPAKTGTSALPGNADLPPCGILNVIFDAHDGHLRSLRYDTVFIIDDEFTLQVSALKPLP